MPLRKCISIILSHKTLPIQDIDHRNNHDPIPRIHQNSTTMSPTIEDGPHNNTTKIETCDVATERNQDVQPLEATTSAPTRLDDLFRPHSPAAPSSSSSSPPPLLALGMLQWGTTPLDHRLINGGALPESEARRIYRAFRSRGVAWFDTAEGYGGGTSEKRLGRLRRREADERGKGNGDASTDDSIDVAHREVIVMTKFLPVPWRFTHRHFENALRASNGRMGISKCPVYLLHSPMHLFRDVEYWVESAAICRKKGLMDALGLINCSAEEVRRAVDAGKKVRKDPNQSVLDIRCGHPSHTNPLRKTMNAARSTRSPQPSPLQPPGLQQPRPATNASDLPRPRRFHRRLQLPRTRASYRQPYPGEIRQQQTGQDDEYRLERFASLTSGIAQNRRRS